jgi:hypothetical protein
MPENRGSQIGFGSLYTLINLFCFYLSLLVLSIVILLDLTNNFGAPGFIIWIIFVILLVISTNLFIKWTKV